MLPQLQTQPILPVFSDNVFQIDKKYNQDNHQCWLPWKLKISRYMKTLSLRHLILYNAISSITAPFLIHVFSKKIYWGQLYNKSKTLFPTLIEALKRADNSKSLCSRNLFICFTLHYSSFKLLKRHHPLGKKSN